MGRAAARNSFCAAFSTHSREACNACHPSCTHLISLATTHVHADGAITCLPASNLASASNALRFWARVNCLPYFHRLKLELQEATLKVLFCFSTCLVAVDASENCRSKDVQGKNNKEAQRERERLAWLVHPASFPSIERSDRGPACAHSCSVRLTKIWTHQVLARVCESSVH